MSETIFFSLQLIKHDKNVLLIKGITRRRKGEKTPIVVSVITEMPLNHIVMFDCLILASHYLKYYFKASFPIRNYEHENRN